MAGIVFDLNLNSQKRRIMFSAADTVEEICREIGRRTSLNRRSLGLSQEDLAVRAGVSKRSVERLESGKANPRLDVLVRVCQTLGLVGGFERLLPEPELGPLAVARGEKLPLRIKKGRRVRGRSFWKENE